MTNAITINDVSKRFRVYKDRNQSLKGTFLKGRRAHYEDFWALQDITFDIPAGKTFGLMGHNGSGKSTLLKCIAKILTPDTGSINATGRMAAMLEVGSGFHPELSGRENIYLNGAILGMSPKEIDSKLDAIIDFSGVERFIDQPVKNYSSGMYVRLGFSVSIHVEPDILLVDEVLAVGDLEFQNKCMEKFAQLKQDGRTVVVVSHGLEQMRSFCDQAAWLDHGKLVEVGNAAQVVDTYSDVAHQAIKVEGGGTRFGTGQAQITKIEVFDESGAPVTMVRPGQAVNIRLDYEAHERIEEPVFGVSIDSRDGVWVWGLHGRDAGFVPRYIEPGRGSLQVHIPALNLSPGSFTISAAIQNKEMTAIIDALQRGRRFDVLPGPGMESGGIVILGASYGNLQPEREMLSITPRGKAEFDQLAREQIRLAEELRKQKEAEREAEQNQDGAEG